MICAHNKLIAKIIPLSNGRLSLREFCTECNQTPGGTRLGFSLPMKKDEDVMIKSFKYPGKTFGEIYEIDPDYLVWVVLESKSSERNKKAAARILCRVPYHPKKDGEIYSIDEAYKPSIGVYCIEQVKRNYLKNS